MVEGDPALILQAPNDYLVSMALGDLLEGEHDLVQIIGDVGASMRPINTHTRLEDRCRCPPMYPISAAISKTAARVSALMSSAPLNAL